MDKKTQYISSIDQLPINKLNINYYTKDGSKIDSEITAIAKEIEYSSGAKYFILINRKNKLFNPIIDKKESKSSKGGGSLLEFNMKEVDQKVFDKYIEFLKTKNTYLLSQSELLRGR